MVFMFFAFIGVFFSGVFPAFKGEGVTFPAVAYGMLSAEFFPVLTLFGIEESGTAA